MRKRKLKGFLLLFIFLPSLIFAQTRQITGVITNQNGEPVSSATVLQKGTQNGVSANEQGAFSISVTGNNPTLVISSTGFNSYEVKVGGESNYNVSLTPSGMLEEVVVTALGISREKKALGYATQEVKAADLSRNHQANLVNALQGKVAGVTISSVGGGPGQGASIRIRGINSIDVTQSNEPLFVIDGIILDNSTSTLGAGSGYNVRTVGNRASDINPEDIETINVLKGGAATALYGLRGANGVVVITTKKGKGTGVRVNFSSTYGFDNINKTPKIQQTYTAGILGVYTPIGLGPAWGPTIAEAKVIDPTHPDQLFDNYKRAYNTGTQARNSINMSGGSEAVKFFSSLSYFDQKGMLPFTNYKNISGRLNTDVRISSKLKSSINMNFTNSGGDRYDADRFGESLTYFSGRWDVKDYLNPDGTQLWRGTNNPIYGAATNRLKDNVNRFVGGIALAYTPFSWLNFNYRVGGDTYSENRFRTAPGLRGITGERTYDNEEGFVGEYNTNFRAINSTFIATISSKLSKDISSTLRLGHELLDRKTTSRGVLGSKLNVFDWFNLRNAAVLQANDNSSQYRLMGIFGEATFDYKSYLFLSVTGRNDITSSLRKPNNSFFYPSVSLSYLVSEHINLPKYISSAKARVSYAKIGKDALPYSTSTGYGAYTSLPAGTTGFTRGSNLGDPNLRPEFTNTIEGGLEMSFFNNRLSFDATYYHSISKDQIINVNVSSATGYVRAAVNSGSMRNKGVELILRGTPVKTSNFSWDASLNFSANRNKVLSIREGLTEIPYGGASGGYLNSPVTMKLIPGEAYGNIYGTHFVRYYGSGKEDPIRTDKSKPMVIGANGFPLLAPVSSQKLLGNSQPDWIGGLTNSFSYKNLTLSTLIDARWGFEKFNRLENFYAAFGIADYTADRREFKVFEGVLADGTPNTKRVWLGQATGPDGVNYGEGYYRNYYRAISEPFVQDASWIRLRSASLAYSLPDGWLHKNVIKNATVSVTGNNLFLHTKYFGLDPESVSADAGSNVDGSAGFTYPAARSFLFTLNVGF
ncbi:SusC/RagA family TonB-linked outer membrane protein [Segetibacter aerophilus]|uniref:SusC/RagA family TonB-linked outer membrane protein n=1 Tax=Segetibacter aerophilus TaxID=670293 RepID=A0A512BJI3_9BACT|nr:SusC/RagA family TonB-linked outer membrane protein [Segetibacter aerophilus]GEO12120.1 SusC/RagA family TonB-linked outer membrane protein [Segetibacter aerophilus]